MKTEKATKSQRNAPPSSAADADEERGQRRRAEATYALSIVKLALVTFIG